MNVNLIGTNGIGHLTSHVWVEIYSYIKVQCNLNDLLKNSIDYNKIQIQTKNYSS